MAYIQMECLLEMLAPMPPPPTPDLRAHRFVVDACQVILYTLNFAHWMLVASPFSEGEGLVAYVLSLESQDSHN